MPGICVNTSRARLEDAAEDVRVHARNARLFIVGHGVLRERLRREAADVFGRSSR